MDSGSGLAPPPSLWLTSLRWNTTLTAFVTCMHTNPTFAPNHQPLCTSLHNIEREMVAHPTFLLNAGWASCILENDPHPKKKNPCGLTISWWGCCSKCLWHEPAELAHSFLFFFRVRFRLDGAFNCISFRQFSRQLSAFSTLFFQPYLCLCGPFNCYISLWKSSALI